MAIPGEGHRLLTLREVAEFLVLTYPTVLNKARTGQIPGAFRLGTDWRVRPGEFKAWVGRGCPPLRHERV
jgi:excisionase family DNA binding protein